MPNQFRTTYVPEPVSFSELGRKIGQGITQDADRMIAISKAHRQEMDANYGFSESLKHKMPAGLDNAYKSGVQLAFDVMNDTAISAKQNPSADNIERHKLASQQYMLFESRAAEKSQFNRMTLQRGLTQGIPGQDATPDEVRALWAKWDVPLDFTLNEETGQIMLGGVPLMDSDALNPDKGLFIVPTVHPSLAFQLDTFVVELQGKALFSNNTNLYKLDSDGALTGEIQDAEVYDLVQREFSHKNGVAQNQAIAVDAYTHFDKGDGPFVTEDLSKAYVEYQAAVDLLEVNGVNISEGALSAEGVYEFTIEEVPAGGVKGVDAEGTQVTYGKATIEKWREAKKYYYEEGAKMIHDGLLRQDKSDNSEGTGPEANFGQNNAPALVRQEDDQGAALYNFSPQQGSMGANLENGNDYDVTNFVLNQRGEVVGIELTAGTTMMENLQRMMDSDEESTATEGLMLFNRDVNITIGFEDANFNRVLTQIKNAQNGTNAKYRNSQFINAAIEKIGLFETGQISAASIVERGWFVDGPSTQPSAAVTAEELNLRAQEEGYLSSLTTTEQLEEHERRVEEEGPWQGIDTDGQPIYGAPSSSSPPANAPVTGTSIPSEAKGEQEGITMLAGISDSASSAIATANYKEILAEAGDDPHMDGLTPVIIKVTPTEFWLEWADSTGEIVWTDYSELIELD